jgi:hypothetical protein
VKEEAVACLQRMFPSVADPSVAELLVHFTLDVEVTPTPSCVFQ